MSDLPPPKPWSIAQFEKSRSHMTDFVRRNIIPLLNDPTMGRILVGADVKVGKREMMEYLAKMDESPTSNRVHVMLSAFARVADVEQRKELEKHNIKVFSIHRDKSLQECLNTIRAVLFEGRTVVIHLDECDYGSGKNQLLSKIYSYLRAPENERNVTILLYSATPYEVLFSSDVGDHQMLDEIMYGTHVEYDPPAGYCGAARFLAEGLVENATGFFTFAADGRPQLTEQGRHILAGAEANARSGNGRNIVMLRLSAKEGQTMGGKDYHKFVRGLPLIPELARGGLMDPLVYADKDEASNMEVSHNRLIVQRIDWANPQYWNAMRRDVPIIIVHDQTASRSTELAFHDRLYALHDHRNTIDMAAFIQAVLRPAHYESTYGGFQPIRIYAHKPTLEYHAGRITLEQWRGISHEWKMVRVNGLNPVVFRIQDSEGNTNPQHPEPIPERRAKEELARLGCGVKLSLSPRLTKPSTGSRPIFDACFFPTTRETFGEDIKRVKRQPGHELFRDHNFENPFDSERRQAQLLVQPPSPDGREIGYLRTWGVWDYDRDVVVARGGGSVTPGQPRLTICYKDGVLGVAVRWHTNHYQEDMNPLRTVRSMYSSPPRA
jgi:hypothetical protein